MARHDWRVLHAGVHLICHPTIECSSLLGGLCVMALNKLLVLCLCRCMAFMCRICVTLRVNLPILITFIDKFTAVFSPTVSPLDLSCNELDVSAVVIKCPSVHPTMCLIIGILIWPVFSHSVLPFSVIHSGCISPLLAHPPIGENVDKSLTCGGQTL